MPSPRFMHASVLLTEWFWWFLNSMFNLFS
jgi:hypothetical protein